MAEAGEALSDRELAVLEKLMDGLTNREIAADLSISPNTVKVHVRNIFTKLEVSSRTEAVTLAIQKGLVTVPVSDSEIDRETQALPETGDLQPLDETTESTPISEPRRLPTWGWIAFVFILLAGLVAGALVNDQLREGEPAATGAEAGTSSNPTRIPIGNSRWFIGDSLPRKRANMAIASVGLDLFLIGGEVDAGIINLVDILESDSGQWRSGSSKPTAVSETSAAVLFGEIIVPGGLLADGRPTAVVESYSPANNAWRPIAPLPKPLAGGLLISDGNTVYFIGGWDGQDYVADAYVYDPVEDQWSALLAMENGRADAAGGLVAGRLYVVGGQNETQALDVCEYYDLDQQSWLDCAPMMMARSYAGAAPLANRFLYVFGGGLAGQEHAAEVLDIQTGNWESVDMPMFEAEVNWSGLGVANIESRLFVLGGWQDQILVDDGYVYAPLTNRTYLPAIGNQ